MYSFTMYMTHNSCFQGVGFRLWYRGDHSGHGPGSAGGPGPAGGGGGGGHLVGHDQALQVTTDHISSEPK